MGNLDTINAAKVAYKALDEKMGLDIKVIDIKNVSIIADYFIIASASNSSQVQALCDNAEDELAKIGVTISHKEGNQTGWVLMDFNDIIVHVFTEEDRNFYNLEKIWKDGILVDVETLEA